MFSLFYGLWEQWFRKVEFHVLILGVDGAGKTTILEQLKRKFVKQGQHVNLEKIPPTVGLNIGRMTISNVKLIFWDLGGQTGLRTIWEKYFTEAHAMLFVVDSADPARFDECRTVLESLLNARDLERAPFMVLANKQDLDGAKSEEEVTAALDIKSKVKDRQFNIASVSGLKGDGLEDSIRWLVDTIKQGPRDIGSSA